MCLRRNLLLFTLLLLVPSCCSLSPQAHAKRLQYREALEAGSITEDRIASNVLKEAELDAEEHEQLEARLFNATFGAGRLADTKTSIGGELNNNKDDAEMDEDVSLPLYTHDHMDAFDVVAEDADDSFQDRLTDGNVDSAIAETAGRREFRQEQRSDKAVGANPKENDAMAQQQVNVDEKLSFLRASSTLERTSEHEWETHVWRQPSWIQTLPKSVGEAVLKVLGRIAERTQQHVKVPQHQINLTLQDLTQQCVPYVVLTMQRSGSTWLQRELPKALRGHVRSGWEAFNVRDNQTGGQLLASAGLTTSYADERKFVMQRVGAMRWAQYIWQKLETVTAPPLELPCAVGFKIMGPDVDAFDLHDTEALLNDPRVKKIILERKSTYDQWISRQWACWSNDYSSHKAGSANPNTTQRPQLLIARHGTDFLRMKEDGSWKTWTQDRIRAGSYCRCGGFTELETFRARKKEVYDAWRFSLRQTRQTWLELQTEDLNADALFHNVSKFLFRDP